MENTGRVMLHEFTHYSTVGPDCLRKFHGCLRRPYAMAQYEGALCLGAFFWTAPKLGTEPERMASLILHCYASFRQCLCALPTFGVRKPPKI